MNSDPERADPNNEVKETSEASSSVLPSNAPPPMQPVFLGPGGLRAGWRIALFVALFLVFMFLAQGLALLLARAGILAVQFGPTQLLVQETEQVACAVAAALAMAAVERRRFGDYGMPWRGALAARFWQGAAWGLGEITALILAIAALGGYSFGGWALGRGEGIRYALLWGLVFLMVGVSEEFLFRGYVQFTAAQAIGFWPAAVLFSAVFGAVHLRNSGEGVAGALGVFLIGMFFCLTLRRTGNLWFAIGAHAAFDFGETYVYSVPDSGLVLPGHLLAASLHGPAWLTGGSVGPEGSVVSFVVLVVVFVVYERASRPARDRAATEQSASN